MFLVCFLVLQVYKQYWGRVCSEVISCSLIRSCLVMSSHVQLCLVGLSRSCFVKVWDSYLEDRAAEWSENCFFEHQRGGLGENLSYFTSTGRPVPPRTVIQRSIGLWAAEKRLWPWSTSCGSACHYTQVKRHNMYLCMLRHVFHKYTVSL